MVCLLTFAVASALDFRIFHTSLFSGSTDLPSVTFSFFVSSGFSVLSMLPMQQHLAAAAVATANTVESAEAVRVVTVNFQ